MYTYRVSYAHENDTVEDESKRHGYASQEVEVDTLVTTKQHLIEIARAIGKEHGYTSVGIVDIKQKIEPNA